MPTLELAIAGPGPAGLFLSPSLDLLIELLTVRPLLDSADNLNLLKICNLLAGFKLSGVTNLSLFRNFELFLLLELLLILVLFEFEFNLLFKILFPSKF